MVLRYHEIAERYRRILNPFSVQKLLRVGRIAGLRRGVRVLDLACGKGEMLCQWARRFGISGVGVDHSRVFLAAAHSRAKEFKINRKVRFVEADAGEYAIDPKSYDAICCIGATWIRENLDGTLRFMLPGIKNNGLAIVGEPFYRDLPLPTGYRRSMAKQDLRMGFRSLAHTVERIRNNGLELEGMVIANEDDWDRYETAHWRGIQRWAVRNADDDDVSRFLAMMRRDREIYLRWERRYLGWGIFIARRGRPPLRDEGTRYRFSHKR